jgi:hypothetical protein
LDRQYRHTIAECAQIANVRVAGGREESMITADNWEVIQGDEGCRDRHYRDKQDLREKTVNGVGADHAAELGPNNSTSLQAQNPTDLGKLRVGVASEEAAGIPAIWNTMLYGIDEMGPIRSAEAFVKINQVTGFDCQSCAWAIRDLTFSRGARLITSVASTDFDFTQEVSQRCRTPKIQPEPVSSLGGR